MTEPILFCPKCRAEMASYQRGDIMISQCGFCRGVFVSEHSLLRLIETGGADLAIRPGFVLGNGVPHGPYEGRHRQSRPG
jgi:Zn-finger nucleic acid-binding protein